MGDSDLREVRDPDLKVGEYVRIQTGKYAGLFGWVEETWYHGGRWWVKVNDHCDLSGYYMWLYAAEVYSARKADEK